MTLPITSVFIALFIAMAFVLTLRAISGRGAMKVSVGDGGEEEMVRLMRAHSNFVETVPLVLVGMVAMELNNAPSWWLITVGAIFLLSRISHAIGMTYRYPDIPFRVVGMSVTGIIFVAVAGTLLWQSVIA